MMDTKLKPEASSQIMIATSKDHKSLHTENRNFPFKLYHMLEFASVSGYSSVFSWTPDGHAFAIHNDDEFLNNILPIFFKQTKLRSFVRVWHITCFDLSMIIISCLTSASKTGYMINCYCTSIFFQTRQLNLWGFHRIVHNCSNKGAWYSEYFVRGQPNDLKNIMRLETKPKSMNTRRPSPPPSSIVDIPTMAAAAAQSAQIQMHFCTPPSPALYTIFEREENMHDDNNLSSENFFDFEW